MSRRLVFVGVETGTIDGIDSSARVVNLDSCGFVPDGDDWADDVTILNLAESHGVPVSDLWAAWEWRRDMVTAGILADVEDYVVRIMPDENPPCPGCHYPLSDHDVAGFPCDGCTESQPMGVWVSSWAVES